MKKKKEKKQYTVLSNASVQICSVSREQVCVLSYEERCKQSEANDTALCREMGEMWRRGSGWGCWESGNVSSLNRRQASAGKPGELFIS